MQKENPTKELIIQTIYNALQQIDNISSVNVEIMLDNGDVSKLLTFFSVSYINLRTEIGVENVLSNVILYLY